MFKLTHLVTFRPGLEDEPRQALDRRLQSLVAALPHALLARSSPALAGSVNGGDMVCHHHFASEADYRTCCTSDAWLAFDNFCKGGDLVRCDTVAYRQEALGGRQPEIANGVHRILLLAIRPFTSAAKVAQFEAEMLEMPRYVPAIRNWGLSRVVEASGARGWTHVWEQEFADLGGLFGPYMMHPIHFAHIDRWFDTQSHDWIVDPELCSTCYTFDQGAMAGRGQSSA